MIGWVKSNENPMMPPGKAISSFVIAVFIADCAAGAAKLSNSNSFPSVRKKILNGVRVAEREGKKINSALL